MEELITIRVNNEEEEIYIRQEEYDELKNISPALVEDRWNEVEDINDKIVALFIISQYPEAWNLIEENLDKVDYARLKKCKYFRINPHAHKAFKYLYDNSIIDKKEYSYYDILSGKLSKEFWDEYIEENKCETFGDICRLVNKTYNGLQNDDVPMIQMGEYEFSLMEKFMQPDEKLDEFVYDNPSFLFPIGTLYTLIEEGHFENVNRIFMIIANLISYDHTAYDQELYDFWKCADKYMKDTEGFTIFNDVLLFSLLANLSEVFVDRWDMVLKLIVNSKETPFFAFTVNHKLREYKEEFGEWDLPTLSDIKISDYLDDGKMSLVVPYSMLGMNIDGYEVIRFVQNQSFAVVNHTTNSILFGDNIYDAVEFTKLKVWNEFRDDPDYQYHEMSDFEKSLLKMNNDDMVIYKEFMLAVLDLIIGIVI